MRSRNCNYIRRRCLGSLTSQNASLRQKQRGEEQEVANIKTSNESHLDWREHFHKISLYIRINAVFGADNETDNTNVGKKQLIFSSKTQYAWDIL